MDTELGSRSKEIFFPGGSKRQIEIKHLAVSSEGEASAIIIECLGLVVLEVSIRLFICSFIYSFIHSAIHS